MILEMLGVKTEEEAVAAIRVLAAPPIVITVVAEATGNVSISCVGNSVSLSAAQDILMAAIRQLAKEDVLRAQAQQKSQQSEVPGD